MWIDKSKDIHVVMSMYNLIDYSDNYSKNVAVYVNIIETEHL